MTYLQDVESAYQEWVRERRAEGKLEGIREGKLEGIREGKIQLANKMIQAKFGIEQIAPDLSDRLSTLSEPQLDELTAKIFEWQQLDRLLEWLDSLPVE